VGPRVVAAGRNCLDVTRWQRAGWRVYRLGAPRP
ncbi:hypothetical protein, partial [Mycobacterium avium]